MIFKEYSGSWAFFSPSKLLYPSSFKLLSVSCFEFRVCNMYFPFSWRRLWGGYIISGALKRHLGDIQLLSALLPLVPSWITITMRSTLLSLLSIALALSANAGALDKRAVAFFDPNTNGGSELDSVGGGLGEPLNVRIPFVPPHYFQYPNIVDRFTFYSINRSSSPVLVLLLSSQTMVSLISLNLLVCEFGIFIVQPYRPH